MLPPRSKQAPMGAGAAVFKNARREDGVAIPLSPVQAVLPG
jgi:hypothetical protein